MSNSIIKNFNIEPNRGFVEKDSNKLYVSMVLNKQSLLLKSVKYVKVCVLPTYLLKSLKTELPGYAAAYERMLYRNKEDKINQYDFEDQLINIIESDSNYQDFTAIIPLEVIYRKIQNIIPTPTLTNPTAVKEFEYPHTFKLYFLDAKKRIIESYSYDQKEEYKISNYDNFDFDDIVQNLLKNSVNIDFREYSLDLSVGPSIVYDDTLDEIEGFDRSKLTASIRVGNKTYNFLNINAFSILLIIAYKSGVVFDLFNLTKVLDDNEFTVIATFSYENFSITKSINIARDKILSLYSAYFRRFKTRFIKEAFRDKISISFLTPGAITINQEKPDLSFYPLTEENIKLKYFRILNGSRTKLDKLFTTENLSESFIVDSINGEFNFQSIYNDLSENNEIKYFTRKPEGTGDDNYKIEVKFNDFIVFPLQFEISSSESEESNTNQKITKESKVFDFVGKSLIQSPLLQGRKLKAKLNSKKIAENRDLFTVNNFSTENNDYLEKEVLDETVAKYTINYSNLKNENVEIVKYCKISEIMLNNEIDIDLPEDAGSFKKLSFDIQTITLPKSSLGKLQSIDTDDDDEKEKVATFLNNALPGSFKKIDNLVRNKLYTNSANKKLSNTIENIFNVNSKKTQNLRIVQNEDENEQIQEEESEEIVIFEDEQEPADILKISDFDSDAKVFFESFTNYTKKLNYLKVYKRKNDKVIATFDLTKILEEISATIDQLSFNLQQLITLEFDSELFKPESVTEEDIIYSDKVLIKDNSYFIFKNIIFEIKQNIMYIKSPAEEEVIEIDEDAYESFYRLWGENETLYINNILERFIIEIIKDNRIVKSIKINNHIEKDYSLDENSLEKTYVLNSDLHMPNIKVDFKKTQR